MSRLLAAFAAGASLLAAGCGLVTSERQATFVLIDVSGTYFDELNVALRATRALTTELGAGDRMTVAQIESCSFSNNAVIVDTRVRDRPSEATAQKRAALSILEGYAAAAARTGYTDIHGALLQAANQLRATEAERKVVVIFSDLVDDPEPGCSSADIAVDLTGVTVIASNVIKLRGDTQNPQQYFDRLSEWERLVAGAGGTWVHAEDYEALRTALAQAR